MPTGGRRLKREPTVSVMGLMTPDTSMSNASVGESTSTFEVDQSFTSLQEGSKPEEDYDVQEYQRRSESRKCYKDRFWLNGS